MYNIVNVWLESVPHIAWAWRSRKTEGGKGSVTYLVNDDGVCRAAPGSRITKWDIRTKRNYGITYHLTFSSLSNCSEYWCHIWTICVAPSWWFYLTFFCCKLWLSSPSPNQINVRSTKVLSGCNPAILIKKWGSKLSKYFSLNGRHSSLPLAS